MNDFLFEQSAWELYLERLVDTSIPASLFLSLLEGESEETVHNAFLDLEDDSISLDITDLPKPVHAGELAQRLSMEQAMAEKGISPDALPMDDPLRIYLEELANIPVCGDIQLLALELAQANRENKDNGSLRMALMNLSLSRVVELAGEYTGRGVLLLDLIQEGSLGLWQGTAGFIGEDFEACRDWWIRQYMAKAVTLQARNDGIGQKLRDLMEDYRAADRRLLTKLGRNPVLEEIALELQMKPEDVAIVEQMVSSARLMAKTKQAAEPKQEMEEDDQSVENTALFQSRQRILDMLSGLNEQEAKVLTLRFGLEGGLPLSPQDTGKKLGLTADQVVALEAAALGKLRENHDN